MCRFSLRDVLQFRPVGNHLIYQPFDVITLEHDVTRRINVNIQLPHKAGQAFGRMLWFTWPM